MVIPIGKNVDGTCDIIDTLATPDVSLQVGSVQVAMAPGCPSSTVSITPLGRLTQEGGVVSTEKKIGNNLH